MRAIRAFSVVAVTAMFATLLVVGGGVATPAMAADPVAGEPLAGTGAVTRSTAQKPSSNFQTGYTTNPGSVSADPVASFGVPANAAPPQHQFNRTLRINDVVLTNWTDVPQTTPVGSSAVLVDGFNYYTSPLTWAQFLPYSNWESTGTTAANGRVHYYLDQQFVQHGSYLIPTVRGLQSPGTEVSGAWRGSQDYNIIWGVGRSWSENGDVIGSDAATRASVPFTLVNQEENCSFNGLMTFLYTDSAISRVHYQVASETCAYFKGNMWGNLPGAHMTDSVNATTAENIRTDFTHEMANRMPTKPVSALVTDYPDAGFDLSSLTQGTTAAHTTAFGFVYKGVNYVSDCVVRTSNTASNAGGVHPFCDQVHLPSYSTAKSIFIGGALMRLVEKYGDSVLDEKVKDWVPELALVSTWNDVTFNNIADMATGHYDAIGNQVDEAGARIGNFFSIGNRTRNSMMTQATGFPYKEAPGQRWVYHTSDSFILSAAMDAYLKDKEGSSADIYAMLYDEVLAPIGVDRDSQTSERTKTVNGAFGNRYNPDGVAWGGFGLWWNRDSIAKIGNFFTNADGKVNGAQVLDADMLAASLQRDPSDRGLATASDPFMYNNSFWARQYTSADNVAFTSDFWVPFMSGYGGITVAMMPNCTTFWRVSDNSEFAWAPVVTESNKLDSMFSPTDAECRTPQPTTLVNDTENVSHAGTVDIDVLDNDGVTGEPALVPSSLKLLEGVDEVDSLTVAGQGTFSIVSGQVRFEALLGYTGDVTANYQVENTDGLVSTASVTVTVASPAPTSLVNDSAAVAHGDTVTVDVLSNDGVTGPALSPSTLRLVDTDNGGALVTTLTVTEGTFEITSDDKIKFAADPSHLGSATATIKYSVGNAQGWAGTANVSVALGASQLPPTLGNDTATVEQGGTALVDVLDNDGAPGELGILASTLTLLDGATGVATLTAPNEGTFMIESGQVRFTALLGFAGTSTATYQVENIEGVAGTATIAVTVAAPALTQLADDNGSVAHAGTVVLDVLGNDGVTGPALDPSTLTLLDGSDNPVSSLVLSQGTFTVTTDNEIQFVADPGYSAAASVTAAYRVGNVQGWVGTASISLALAAAPTAPPGATTLTFDVAVVAVDGSVLIDVLANDGLPGEPALVASTLMMLDSAASPVSSLTAAGGTFTVEAGKIRFVATDGFSGTATANYQVENTDGLVSTASVTVTVAAPGLIPPVSNSGSVSATGEGISVTGSDGASLAVVAAGILLVAGIVSVGLARVRKSSRRRQEA